jgi:enamine deaminase RidA (YjgF/YER057c/UK114 family)
MTKRAIIPAAARPAAEHLKMSPGILSGDHLFLTGVTGSGPDGAMPPDAEAQFRSAFTKIGSVLTEADLTFDHIVEMTTYHIGLRDHFDLFDAVRLEHFNAPYPAWTAIEAGGLRREGALVEIRVIACKRA